MKIDKIAVVVLTAAALTPLGASALSVDLTAVTFPERRNVDLEFRATEQAPQAKLSAEVDFRESQAAIEIKYDEVKPAVLFGGDVTCYVVWAVSQDGGVENLGELWMPDKSGRVELSTGRKSFALVITAEPYSQVDTPSALVMFSNLRSDDKRATNASFSFDGFAPAPDHELESIRRIAWDSSVPLDLEQAEKAVELARRAGAEDYAGKLIREATIALGQARNLASASKNKQRIDYSRRATARAGEAIRVTLRAKEAEELERQIAARRAEMDTLNERAASAEQRSAEAEEALAAARAAIAGAEAQRAAAEQAAAAAELELGRLDGEKQALQQEQASLMASMATLRQEREELLRQREELSSRLQGALSKVADTRDSARGFIVNLPDILFDVNKATLKTEAQLVIAKLAGILLIMPELNLRIEGHTDSQGSDEYNQGLSEQRAGSVRTFLESNGIDNSRMTAVGYGENRPVADNTTADGRQKNRRVEIVIAQGVVAEAGE